MLVNSIANVEVVNVNHPVGSVVLLYRVFLAGGVRRYAVVQGCRLLMHAAVVGLILMLASVDYGLLWHGSVIQLTHPFSMDTWGSAVWSVVLAGNVMLSVGMVAWGAAMIWVDVLKITPLTRQSIVRHRGNWVRLCDALHITTEPLYNLMERARTLIEDDGCRITPLRMHLLHNVMTMWQHLSHGMMRRRCKWLSYGMALVTPFGCIAYIAYLCTETAQAFHTKSFSGMYDWSPEFKVLHRQHREPPHQCHARLKLAAGRMDQYMQQTINPAVAAVAHLVSFLCAGTLMLITMAALLEEDVLTRTHVWGRNLLWYAALLTGTIMASRTMIPNLRKARVTQQDVLECLNEGTTWSAVERHYGQIGRAHV